MTPYIALFVMTNLVRCVCPCGFCTENTAVPEHINRIGYDLKFEVVTNQIQVRKQEEILQMDEDDEYEYAAMLITTNLVRQQCKCGFCNESIVVPEHINQIGYDLRIDVSTNYIPIVRRNIKKNHSVKPKKKKCKDPTVIAVEKMLKELDELEYEYLDDRMDNHF